MTPIQEFNLSDISRLAPPPPGDAVARLSTPTAPIASKTLPTTGTPNKPCLATKATGPTAHIKVHGSYTAIWFDTTACRFFVVRAKWSARAAPTILTLNPALRNSMKEDAFVAALYRASAPGILRRYEYARVAINAKTQTPIQIVMRTGSSTTLTTPQYDHLKGTTRARCGSSSVAGGMAARPWRGAPGWIFCEFTMYPSAVRVLDVSSGATELARRPKLPIQIQALRELKAESASSVSIYAAPAS